MTLFKAPVGSLLKGDPMKRRGKVEAPPAERGKDEGHLAFIRRLPCLVTNKRPVDAAHVAFSLAIAGKPATGIGRKADDMWTIPLNNTTHLWDQHTKGESVFWKDVGLTKEEVVICCLRLKLVSLSGGDIRAGEKVLADTRSRMKGPR